MRERDGQPRVAGRDERVIVFVWPRAKRERERVDNKRRRDEDREKKGGKLVGLHARQLPLG